MAAPSNDSHTYKEKIKSAIQWIEDGAVFTRIHDVPELLKTPVQNFIQRCAERHIEELVRRQEITPDEVAHSHNLMQISQGKLEWTKELVADTRNVLGGLSEWARETQLDELQERLNRITKKTDRLPIRSYAIER